MFENGRFSADIIETTDEEGNVHVFEKVDEYVGRLRAAGVGVHRLPRGIDSLRNAEQRVRQPAPFVTHIVYHFLRISPCCLRRLNHGWS